MWRRRRTLKAVSRRAAFAAAAGVAWIDATVCAAAKADAPPSSAPLRRETPLWREAWAGGDATPHIWLLYSGDVWSPGLKLRAAGGYGQYRYAGKRGKEDSLTSFHGQIRFAEAMAGYLWRFGPLTAKAFAGLAAIEHAILPLDPLASNGLKFGPKGALEVGLNLSDKAWTSLDLTYTTAHATYAARTRLGYRLLPTVSLGPEAALNGSAGRTVRNQPTDMLDPAHRDIRFGGFVRYEWFGGEISAAGGLSTDLENRRDPYVTLNAIYQF
jgi:hypothetical protein